MRGYELRKAIAMIELIFAIVIIGFALLSVPNLLSVAARSGYVALQQEAIAESSAHINLITSKHWDENNAILTPAVILTTTAGDASLAARPGIRGRSMPVSAPPATSIGSESTGFNDMDDAHGTTMRLRQFTATAVTAGNTIDKDIIITSYVQYMNDTVGTSYNTSSSIQFDFDPSVDIPVPSGTTNIKFIRTILTSDNASEELNQKVIKFNAFSCNIGQQLLELNDKRKDL